MADVMDRMKLVEEIKRGVANYIESPDFQPCVIESLYNNLYTGGPVDQSVRQIQRDFTALDQDNPQIANVIFNWIAGAVDIALNSYID